ncbi:hypothetical protein [Herbaspirillum sp. B65]|uniref:hypothetical protein n=1 Tax=Herbaspirillum sp. B65 TaxID=137708 RepID=UPI0005C8ABC2|nr:hypothetical protein [Herbaspirillum sp. B65]
MMSVAGSLQPGFFNRISQTNAQEVAMGMIFGGMNPAGPVGDKEMNDRFVVAHAKIKSLRDLEITLSFLRHQIFAIQGNQSISAEQNAGIKRGPPHGSDAVYQAIPVRCPDILQTRNVFGRNFSEAYRIGPDVVTHQGKQVGRN